MTTRPAAGAFPSPGTATHPRSRCPPNPIFFVDNNGLDGTGRHRPTNTLTLGTIGSRVVQQRFLTVQHEYIRRKKGALSVALAPVEIDHQPHTDLPFNNP